MPIAISAAEDLAVREHAVFGNLVAVCRFYYFDAFLFNQLGDTTLHSPLVATGHGGKLRV